MAAKTKEVRCPTCKQSLKIMKRPSEEERRKFANVAEEKEDEKKEDLTVVEPVRIADIEEEKRKKKKKKAKAG